MKAKRKIGRQREIKVGRDVRDEKKRGKESRRCPDKGEINEDTKAKVERLKGTMDLAKSRIVFAIVYSVSDAYVRMCVRAGIATRRHVCDDNFRFVSVYFELPSSHLPPVARLLCMYVNGRTLLDISGMP